MEINSFLQELIPSAGNNENVKVVSPESVPIHLYSESCRKTQTLAYSKVCAADTIAYLYDVIYMPKMFDIQTDEHRKS